MNDYPTPAMTDAAAKRPRRPSQLRAGRVAKTVPKCKTCVSCRLRKAKCDGARPRCTYCATLDRDCTYPHDARCLNKPTAADVRQLQASIEALWGIIEDNNIAVDDSALRRYAQFRTAELLRHSEQAPDAGASSTLPPPGQTTTAAAGAAAGAGAGAGAGSRQLDDDGDGLCHGALGELSPARFARPGTADSSVSQLSEETELASQKELQDSTGAGGPSPSEVRIAGAISQNGDIQVHGVSSLFHMPDGREPDETASTAQETAHLANETSSARLVAYAALQRQREPLFLRNPNTSQCVDFDGVDAELALHLIDLHFNRQHYTYLITYRPAIVDSLLSKGAYCNKVLLNAIYLSSSVYSDRVELRSDAADPRTAGERFYRRLRVLLVDEIDRPSIPTAVGLLLCGAILMSTGRHSAGWVHSGIAYRMITDLGCHLTIERPRSGLTSEMALLTDVELEVRKRLYWGAFLTDATQSLYFGRPPSLRASQARVPQLLLDTYEELDGWTPYIDRLSPVPPDPVLASYAPRPAYAISTFNALVRLLKISSRILHAFYSMQSLKYPSRYIRRLKTATESELDRWHAALPGHLKFSPDRDTATPPPHQITLLTTYYTIQILLRRPGLANGHLSAHFSADERAAAERRSVDAALAIWRLVDSYKAAFTLSRAPYLVSYSVYSAIVAILNQRLAPRAQFADCMRFFWTALIDLQRGCNFGLQKPMEILRDMMHQFGRFGEDIQAAPPRRADTPPTGPVLQPAEPCRAGLDSTTHDDWLFQTGDPAPLTESDLEVLWASVELGDVSDWPVNDALYGLFTSDLPCIG